MTKLLICTCLLYMLSFSAQAMDYHVCSNGNDSNGGLSHGTAWKTYTKAQSAFSSLNGGDSIRFCKGEEFAVTGGTRWVNFNSTSDNRVTISSYTPPGSTNLNNPTLNAPKGSVFRMEDGGNANHDEGYVISNLILKGGSSGWAIFIYNDSDFIDILEVEIYNFGIGMFSAISTSFVYK